MTAVIGIDKGTTATKAVVFDADTGRAIATARRPAPVFHPLPDRHEEDTEATFAAAAGALREAVEAAGLPPGRIAAVGVSGHMGGLWALDAAGRPVGRAIAWPDARAAALLDEWGRDGRTGRLGAISGNAPIPGLPLVLLSWHARHEPQRLERIATLFAAKDYLNFRLTGEIATDESDLSFFPCDIRRRAVSEELMDLAGVPQMTARIAPVLPTGATVGRVTAEAAALTGLPAGIPVTTGAGDAVAAAIGAGALAPGQAVTVIGTSFMNNLTVDRPLVEPAGVGFLFLMPGGRWQRLMANTGGGSLCLDWALRAFGRAAWGDPDAAVFARLDEALRAVPPVPGGLIVHPYLGTSGMTAPRHEPFARGSVFGLDAATTPAALVRATMEGVAFAMVDCYGAMAAPVNAIRITGGGARLPVWREICAAAIDRPLSQPAAEETGALGAAMLAAVAAGIHPDLDTAARAMVHLGPEVRPDADLAARYRAAYPLFRDLGSDLAVFWRHRARLVLARSAGEAT